MKPFFLFLALLAAMAVLLLRICCAAKKKRLPKYGSINVLIIVKNQESWIEGFIRKLYIVIKDTTHLNIYMVDDCSCDRTPEILNRLGRIYPLQVLSAGEDRFVNEWDPASESEPAAALHFDVRGLRGRELLNAPLFCHLSHLNEGKSQVLSK